jgi:copper(I)-binding protein
MLTHRFAAAALALVLPIRADIALAADQAAHPAGAAKGITVSEAWSRPASGIPVGVGYLKITNNGSEPDVLAGGSTDVAERIELHETTVGDDGVTRMRKLDEVMIAPGATIELKPAGMHMMLLGLKGPLKEGETFKAKLDFKKAGAVDAEFAIRAAGAAPPAHQH